MEKKAFEINVMYENFPILAEDLAKATRVNAAFSKVYQIVHKGWPQDSEHLADVLKTYF